MKDRECLRNAKYEHRRNKAACENALQDFAGAGFFRTHRRGCKLNIKATCTGYAAEIAKVMK
jgi:hypothetical protein